MHSPLTRRPARWFASLLGACLAAAAGVATPRSAVDPAGALAGDWVVSAAGSDDFQAALERLLAARRSRADRQREAWRRRAADSDIPPLPDGPPGGEPRDRERARLAELLQPAPALAIVAGATALEIAQSGDPARRYSPETDGQRMDAFGTALWQSSWQGAQFVIRARYTDGATREQRFSIDPHNGDLLVQLRFSDGQNGKLQVTTRYTRSAGEPQGL